jgi:class 3 adenylate cyclase
VAVVLLLVGLPLAVWLDLRSITQEILSRQAHDLNTVVSGIRSFYSSDVVGRVLDAHGRTEVTSNYESVPGGIPIPATFSLQLAQVIGADQNNIRYRFVSDYPFRHRAPHVLDDFERSSLASLRAQPNQPQIVTTSFTGATDTVRVIAPIIMGQTCVDCHNVHPDSPKRDWKVGDVRGIQELIVTAPVATNLFSFRFLLLYFVIAAAVGIAFILAQRRQAEAVAHANTELNRTNAFLESISRKIARYLAPQVFARIFSGAQDVAIATERKKLTIFFSDIKDFTSTTERLQPEELTALLNEYFTAMSAIALAHGGTIDKFIGDAIVIFFGDPETKGAREDALACVRMALAMQDRLAALNAAWRNAGIEVPFRVRMGVNTGYCNVGNFGSSDRMDYTIIGAEANLAARLQSIAEPGQVVVSYETYALVRDEITAHALAPIHMKGISREVIPYAIDGTATRRERVFATHEAGVDVYIDPARLDPAAAEHVRTLLRDALRALES